MISEETRRKLIESHKGYHPSEETRRKISIALVKRVRSEKEIQRLKAGLHKGFKHSEETRKKMSEAWKTRPPISEETRKRISEAMQGEKHHRYGTHPSEETLQKLRDSHKGIKRTKEALKKLSQSLKGHPTSEETRKRIGDAQRGEKGHNWKGGRSFEPYCPKFNEKFKERIRAFFGYQCIECGTPQNGIRLHIHHVNFNKKACCDSSIPLFVPLCTSCHGKTNGNRDFWGKHFTEIINTYYQGRCYFTSDEMSRIKGGM